MRPRSPLLGVLRVAAVVAISCLSTGCVRTVQLPGVPATESVQAAFLDAVRKRSAEVPAGRVLAKAVIQQGEERGLLRYAIAFQRPESLRIEMLPSAGGFPLAAIAVNAEGTVVLDMQSKQAYVGEAESSLLQSMIRIPLRPEQLMSYIVGRVPESALVQDLEARELPEATALFATKDRSATWAIHPDGTLSSVVLRRPNRRAVESEIHYSEYRNSEGVLIPGVVTISLPSEGVQVRLTVQKFERARDIPPGIFHLEVPPHFSRSSGWWHNL